MVTAGELVRSGSTDKLVNLQFQEKRALIASSFKSEMINNQLKADLAAAGQLTHHPAYIRSDVTMAGSEMSGSSSSGGFKNDTAAAAGQLPALRNIIETLATLSFIDFVLAFYYDIY